MYKTTEARTGLCFNLFWPRLNNIFKSNPTTESNTALKKKTRIDTLFPLLSN